RVRPRDVVVVRVLHPPDDAARLVLLSRNRLELHFNKTVLEAGVILEADRKGRFARLLQNVRLARGGIVLLDAPLRGAAASLSRSPSERRCASFKIIKVHGVG